MSAKLWTHSPRSLPSKPDPDILWEMGKHKRILQRLLLITGLALFAFCNVPGAVAQDLTTGYQSDQDLQNGMIVRLKPGDSTKVEPLSQKNAPDMLGVVVSAGDTTVSLSNPGATQALVATTGQYGVLVSDQGGPIKEGDFITVSSVSGIGMKASSVQKLIIGKALKGFDGKTGVDGTTTLQSNNGKKTVHLGRVPVEILMANNPLYEAENTSGVPRFLSKAAQIVTDRPVTAFRIYASAAVIILSLIVAGGILYAGVRSGMTSIGRNPLAKHSIMRSLIQVTLMALIVFVIGVFAVYLLLRI